MKFLVLLRHGIAEERTAEKPDAERQLTTDGRKRMRQIARGLARVFPAPEAIYSSPLVRCVQTAELVAKGYADTLELQTSDALRPEARPDDFRRLLSDTEVEFAIFVGHEPNLSEIMLTLTKMDGGIELKRGGCYGIRFDGSPEGGAALEWMLPPRVLRLR